MTQEAELPPLNDEQLAVLRGFASSEVGIEEIRRSLGALFEFNLVPGHNTAVGHFRMPEPGIAITRSHISNALEKNRLGLISERDLVHWATILLLNDAFVLDPEDEDFIAEWLNDISINLDAT